MIFAFVRVFMDQSLRLGLYVSDKIRIFAILKKVLRGSSSGRTWDFQSQYRSSSLLPRTNETYGPLAQLVRAADSYGVVHRNGLEHYGRK